MCAKLNLQEADMKEENKQPQDKQSALDYFGFTEEELAEQAIKIDVSTKTPQEKPKKQPELSK